MPCVNSAAVRSSAAPRSPIPTNGCVPLNRFGVGVASQEALDYVLGTPLRTQKFQQDVAALNFTTNAFEGWAGPIGIAFGIEHRKEEVSGVVDPQFESGWKYGNYRVTTGDYNVSEAYVEAEVPIMKALNFNTAFRYTDYSTSGGVNTWKLGFTYQLIEDVMFRASKSRDIRAPNLSELYDAGTARTNNVVINGQSVSFVQNLQGSQSVKPEEADTWGAGVVLTPRFVPGAEPLRGLLRHQARRRHQLRRRAGRRELLLPAERAEVLRPAQVQGHDAADHRSVLRQPQQHAARGLDLEATYRRDLAGGLQERRRSCLDRPAGDSLPRERHGRRRDGASIWPARTSATRRTGCIA